VLAERKDDGNFREVVFQLLGAGRELARSLEGILCAVAFGEDGHEELAKYGADKIYVIEGISEFVDTRGVADALSSIVQKYNPEIFIAGATDWGREVMPRVAVRVGTGITADCVGLYVEDGLLVQDKPSFSGGVIAKIVCPKTRPQMATVREGIYKLPEPVEGKGELVREEFACSDFEGALKILSRQDLQRGETLKLRDADIIVAGGRGMGGEDGFKLLFELAELLGGAVGATRGAVDEGWIGHEHQIGQTGCVVRPRLYIACGISGAVQHIVGMREAEVVIAINKDRNAPIFEFATLGIVGDVFGVLPALIERLKNMRTP